MSVGKEQVSKLLKSYRAGWYSGRVIDLYSRGDWLRIPAGTPAILPEILRGYRSLVTVLILTRNNRLMTNKVSINHIQLKIWLF
jgi:hypothetical protein